MKLVIHFKNTQKNIQQPKPNDTGSPCLSMTYLGKSECTMTASFLPSGGGGGGRVCLPFCTEQKYLSTSTGANTLSIPSLLRNTDPMWTCEAQYKYNSNKKLLFSKISLPIWYLLHTLYFLIQVSSQWLAMSRRLLCWSGLCFAREFQDSNSGHNHSSASSTPNLCSTHSTKALPEI